MSNNILKQYVDEIYNQADILLTQIEEKNFKEELELALIEKIGSESIDMLDDSSKDEYYDFLETKPVDDEIRSFFVSHIDNFDEKINSVIINFCSEIITKIKTSIILASTDVDKYSDKLDDENKSIEEILIDKNKIIK